MNDCCARKSILYSITLAIGCTILGACNSGTETTNSDSEITGQAIDGYIVGGRTFCDTVEKQVTKVAGKYICPEGTKVVKVIGGYDVGYDETATTSDVSFNGVLLGPTIYDHITPVTTLAIELSGGEENYDSSKLETSILKIKQVLNITSLDLNNSPAKSVELAKLGAQINRIVGTFSASRDEYEQVIGSLANLIDKKSESNETININGSDESMFTQTMQDFAQVLTEDHPKLEVLNNSNTDLDDLISLALIDVKDIQTATAPSDLEPIPTFQDPALAFSTDEGIVSFTGPNDQTYSYSVTEYENSTTDGQGKHVAVLPNGIRHISLANSLIQVEKTLTNASIDFAFSIAAEKGNKKLNVIVKDIKVSMVANDSSSIKVTIPDGKVWQVQSISEDGTSTRADIVKNGDRIFSSSNDGININMDDIADELTKKGHPDLTKETGNYKVTLVISGIEVARLSGSNTTSASKYVVKTNDSLLGGPGLRGYVTVE